MVEQRYRGFSCGHDLKIHVTSQFISSLDPAGYTPSTVDHRFSVVFWIAAGQSRTDIGIDLKGLACSLEPVVKLHLLITQSSLFIQTAGIRYCR